MNVMTFAHYMTRRTIKSLARGNASISYKRFFSAALSDAHHFLRRGVLESKMQEVKAIDKRITEETSVVRSIVRNAFHLGYTVSVCDGEEWTVKRTTKEQDVMNAIQTTDMDVLSFRDAEGVKVGNVWLVYGNSASEVMADWSDNEVTNQILSKAISRCDRLAMVGR